MSTAAAKMHNTHSAPFVSKTPEGYKLTEAGMLPSDWELEPVEKLASISTGSRNTQDRTEGGTYPFFVRSQVVERINSYSYDEEAVLTAGDGVGTGKVFHYINGKYDAHQRVYRIFDFRPDVSGFYFFLYFSANFYRRIMQMTAKSSVDSVRREMISRMVVPVPPTTSEQKAIAEALSDADALIESLEQLIAKKRAIKQGAMQELLTGKRRLPGFKGEWINERLGMLADFRTGPFGSALHKSDYTDSGVPVVNPMHIVNGTIVPTTSMTVTEAAASKLSDFRLNPGEVVIGRRGEMGRCAVVRSHQIGWLCGTGSMIIRPHKADPDFLQILLSTPRVVAAITESSVGTTMVNLNQSILSTLKLYLPQIEEQRSIAALLNDMESEIGSAAAKLAKARSVKQGMMQELLTGRKRLV